MFADRVIQRFTVAVSAILTRFFDVEINIRMLGSGMRSVWRSLLLLALLTPAVAKAQPAADETDRARARYEAGRSLYQVGRYDDAIREFSAGYDASQKPRFLYNLALCYRKLGDLSRTRDYLRRYLSVAPESDTNRHSIEGQLAEQAEANLRGKGKEAVPVLIGGLSDRSMIVRRKCNDLLKIVSKQDFSYDPRADEDKLTKAIDAWKKWAVSQKIVLEDDEGGNQPQK